MATIACRLAHLNSHTTSGDDTPVPARGESRGGSRAVVTYGSSASYFVLVSDVYLAGVDGGWMQAARFGKPVLFLLIIGLQQPELGIGTRSGSDGCDSYSRGLGSQGSSFRHTFEVLTNVRPTLNPGTTGPGRARGASRRFDHLTRGDWPRHLSYG